MTNKNYKEKREFLRLGFRKPFDYKICKEDTISSLLNGYTRDISQAGICCSLDKEVPLKSTLWIRLDMSSLEICHEIEKRSIILQSGVLGQVVWETPQDDGSYEVGVSFITKEEKKKQDIDKWLK